MATDSAAGTETSSKLSVGIPVSFEVGATTSEPSSDEICPAISLSELAESSFWLAVI